MQTEKRHKFLQEESWKHCQTANPVKNKRTNLLTNRKRYCCSCSPQDSSLILLPSLILLYLQETSAFLLLIPHRTNTRKERIRSPWWGEGESTSHLPCNYSSPAPCPRGPLKLVQAGTSLELETPPPGKGMLQVKKTVNALPVPWTGQSSPNSSWWKLFYGECYSCLKKTFLREDVLL